jgi:hypothetical protein
MFFMAKSRLGEGHAKFGWHGFGVFDKTVFYLQRLLPNNGLVTGYILGLIQCGATLRIANSTTRSPGAPGCGHVVPLWDPSERTNYLYDT